MKSWLSPNADQRRAAAVCLAIGVLLTSTGVYTTWSPDWDPARPVRLLPLLVLCAALLRRKSAPGTALAVGALALAADIAVGPSLGVIIAWTYVLDAVALHGPRRMADWLIVANTAVVVIAGLGVLVLTHDIAAAALTTATVSTASIVPVLGGFAVREYRDRAEAERQRAAQTARLAELDHLAAVTAERARMARELHDVVANHLSAVAVQSGAALAVKNLDNDALRGVLAVIRENSVQGLTEMRRMIGLLRSADGLDGDAGDVMPGLAEADRLADLARAAGLTVDLKTTGDPYDVPVPVDLAGYRIVQETLTNALKHASPKQLTVRIDYHPEMVVITGDNGLEPGAVTALPGARAGLVGMAERVGLLGGVFDAGPRAGRWHVRAELPCSSPEEL